MRLFQVITLFCVGIAAERKEAKQEKDEAEKYKKLREDFMQSRLHTMLFKLFYNDKEIEEIKADLEVSGAAGANSVVLI